METEQARQAGTLIGPDYLGELKKYEDGIRAYRELHKEGIQLRGTMK